MSSPLPKDRDADRSSIALWLAHPARPTVPGLEVTPGALFLEALSEAPEALRRVTLSTFPFRVGRQAGLELVLPSYVVSKVHAEIYQREGQLRIRDLGSRNGTFVNRKTITDTDVAEDDVIQIGDFQFRLSRPDGLEHADDEPSSTRSFAPGALARLFQ